MWGGWGGHLCSTEMGILSCLNMTDLYLNCSVTVNSTANARRIADVEQSFGSAGQPLGVPGRVLVGEGVLTKACRKKPKPRQFFLFNDILVYGNIIINKKKYTTQHIIPLEVTKALASGFSTTCPINYKFDPNPSRT